MAIEIAKAIVLGIVEGVTEFLPVSSTGHLILVNQWISFSKSFTEMFDIVIQLGAILAVAVYFRKRLWPFGKDQADNKRTFDIWKKTLIGVIPAIILGALFGKMIEAKLFNPWTVAIALIIGGVILIYIERNRPVFRFNSVAEIPLLTAFYIGAIQCLSMIPGTSRSGATIVGALLLGASRAAAVEFSFFLAIPTMIAASGYSLLKHGLVMSGTEFTVLVAGFIVAFVTALLVIKVFMEYIQRHDFRSFGYYRIALGLLIIIFFLMMRGIFR